MKNYLKLAAALCAIVLSVGIVSAQKEKRITEAEMTEIQNKAKEKLKGARYRVTITMNLYLTPNTDKLSSTSRSVTEYAPEGSRWINETNNNGKLGRQETITLGERRFTRMNDEAWRELAPGQVGGSNGGEGKAVPIKNENKDVDYKYLGKKVLDNREVDVYQIKTVRKNLNDNDSGVSVSIERLWYDSGNRLIKTERDSRYNGKLLQDTALLYEYDPNIKIEAPIK